MRNWNSNDSLTLFQPSNKSSARKVNDTETTTMASDLCKNNPADSGLSQSKHDDQEKETTTSAAFDPSTLAASTPFTHAAEKKLLRKLDLHLIPFLALLYL
jgi:hypothetical protein